MPTCDNCGEHVTPRYFRVFSIDDTLHSCYRDGCGTMNGDHRPAEMKPDTDREFSVPQ